MPWVMFSTVGGFHDKCGGYLGGVQYRGKCHDKCRGYLEYRGGCSVPWGNVMSTVGNIMSTVGRYLEYRGDIIIHMADIISTVRGVQYSGGYHSL